MNNFIERHTFEEINFDEWKNFYQNPLKLHNWTLPNLFLYFSLEKFILKSKVHFYPGIVLFDDKRRYKWFIFYPLNLSEYFDFSLLSEEVKKKTVFYSSFPLEDDFLTKSKFKETIYEISKIFDFQPYLQRYGDIKVAKKKYYNRVTYPFKFIEKLEDFQIRDLEESDLEEVFYLHKRWCDFKLNDPKVFKMMFSSNRYYRCLEESFRSSYLSQLHWFRKGFFYKGRLVAVRQCFIDGDTSFDIGFFSSFWELPSNLINYINTWCMKSLEEGGVKFHNTGNELDKNLALFKHHLIHTEKYGYKYNFKIDKNESCT